MAHINKIIDADAFFEVNAYTRQIINKTPQKSKLIQYDHNSERFTFSLPRFIDGHDMAEVDKAEVYYINIDAATGEKTEGNYEMTDLQVDEANAEKVHCSWLISQNATGKIGVLSFLLRFSCFAEDGSTVEYAWNTAIYNSILIEEGIYNPEAIVEQYADVLAQWKATLFEINDDGVKNVKEASAAAKEELNSLIEDFTTDEENRVQAENIRQQNEQNRVDAETQREGSFETLHNDTQSLKTELEGLVEEAGQLSEGTQQTLEKFQQDTDTALSDFEITSGTALAGFAGDREGLIAEFYNRSTQALEDFNTNSEQAIGEFNANSGNALTEFNTKAETKLGELNGMIEGAGQHLTKFQNDADGALNVFNNQANTELEKVQTATNKANSAATHQPIIGDNNHWFVWDIEEEIYVDTGIMGKTNIVQITGESETDAMSQKATTEALLNLANKVAPSPASVTLYADRWEQDDEDIRYHQEVVVANATITPRSKVDLQLSAEQITIFYEKDLAFVAENENGVVTVYCIGQVPENDYIIQATVSEVIVNV